MRLGGPVFCSADDPERYMARAVEYGWRAVPCPLYSDASDDWVQAFVDAARGRDVVIAEVGAWSNPLASDSGEREAALERCRAGLELAERVGARCCVNIAGSRGSRWDGPHPDNLTDETFEMIVAVVRDVLDAVRPKRTWYTLETMPWVFPDSAESYERLIRAVDRERFGVHFDPVNLINSPRRYFHNGDFIRDCIRRLGPYIRSCHAKDIVLEPRLTVHLNEARPGTGMLDYATFLRELARLDPDMPLLLEHLPEEKDYLAAADYIRRAAGEAGVSL